MKKKGRLASEQKRGEESSAQSETKRSDGRSSEGAGEARVQEAAIAVFEPSFGTKLPSLTDSLLTVLSLSLSLSPPVQIYLSTTPLALSQFESEFWANLYFNQNLIRIKIVHENDEQPSVFDPS